MSDCSQESLLKQLISQFMEEQLNTPSEDKTDNHSLLFLENRTMNLLILSMLMNQGWTPHTVNLGDTRNTSHTEIVKRIDKVIEESKLEFEEILSLLKK